MIYDELIRVHDGLLTEMRKVSGYWDTMKRYLKPDADDKSRYCSTAAGAARVLSSGHLNGLCPMNSKWYEYKTDSDDVVGNSAKWCGESTRIVGNELSRSNFYTEIQSMFDDRSMLGTGAIFCDKSKKDGLFFKHIPLGSFSCAENDEGIVDTISREFKMSADQAASMFGEGALGEKVREAYGEVSKRYDPIYEFIHIVRPRKRFDDKKGHQGKMPFESWWISKDDKKVVEEKGFWEFPYCVSPFLKSEKLGAFGLPAGWFVRQNMDDLRVLQESMKKLAQVAADPRMVRLASQVGEIDMRAGGITLITPEEAQLNVPREIGAGGRYDIGKDMIEVEKEEIRDAFMYKMFRIVSDLERQVTATQVMSIENEKILAFSPSFTLFASSFMPFMERIFNLCARLGKFDKIRTPVPKELLTTIPGEDAPRIKMPKVRFTGRIAMSLDRYYSDGTTRSLQACAELAPAFPGMIEVFRNQGRDAGFEISRVNGSSEKALNGEQEIKAIDAQKDQAQQMQQELIMAQIGAGALKDGTQAVKNMEGKN